MRSYFCIASLLTVLVTLLPQSSHAKGRTGARVKRHVDDLLGTLTEMDSRLYEVRDQIDLLIPYAIESVEDDIVIANRNRAILGLSNFFGMIFGIANGANGDFAFGNLTRGAQLQVIAQAMYGYGYWGPFVFEFEAGRLDCGRADLRNALAEFSFLTDMDHNYGYLNGRAPESGQYGISSSNDPILLQYYALELNHAIKRGLYCLTSRKGSNTKALELNTMIDLYTQLLTDRLSMTQEAVDQLEDGDGYNSRSSNYSYVKRSADEVEATEILNAEVSQAAVESKVL